MTELTADRLREILDYDPETGVLSWRYSPRYGIAAGQAAGCVVPKGYLSVRVRGREYLGHRLAWLHYYGEWPIEVDHINRVKLDNRIVNLRRGDGGINQENRVFSGAWRHRNKWKSFIRTGGKREYLGIFPTREEAEAAYLTAKRERHVGFVEARHVNR